MFDSAAKQVEAAGGVAHIGGHHFPALPAATLLHAHRHVEVVEVDKRGDPLGQQSVKEGVVEADRLLVDFAHPVRDQP